MFIGHFAVALAAKSQSRETPLWTLMTASQLLDYGWSGLVAAGIEKVRVDPTLKGSPFDLYHMPYTHSLPAALLWSALAAGLARRVLGQSRRSALVIAAVVFSHWLLDLLVHRPDLSLGISALKVGLGLWDYPAFELELEFTLFTLGATLWWRSQPQRPGAIGIMLLVWLFALQVTAEIMTMPTSPVLVALNCLASYLSVSALAWWAERPLAATGTPY